ncbi:MAG: hypothetical protein Q4C41_04680 [Eggerthellaceae bacterium]|nr:hypothetical protein [Eggerthellaceae bacterium]
MPVVQGIEVFKDAMKDHAGDYVLIGGGACSILFDQAGQSFRATEDLDVVVLAERCDASFAEDFWSFVRSGGYVCGKRDEGKCTYYRFNLPKSVDARVTHPAQIELFAKHPGFLLEDESSEVAPLPFDESVSSLSAIILNEGYYEFIRDNVAQVSGVPLLSAVHIIPLKMRAHIDINDKYREGRHYSQKDLRKHRIDVARLSRLLAGGERLELDGQMRADAEKFLADFGSYAATVTNRKERGALLSDLSVLRGVYL